MKRLLRKVFGRWVVQIRVHVPGSDVSTIRLPANQHSSATIVMPPYRIELRIATKKELTR